MALLGNKIFTQLSRKEIIETLDKSEEFLLANPNIADEISVYLGIPRSLFSLIPESAQTILSGHNFPIMESMRELEYSIHLVTIGFYKHALIALRNALELGLLSVYWDIDDSSYIDVGGWYRSLEWTPFKKKIFKKFETNKNIASFNQRINIFDRTNGIYGELSNVAHTKGAKYSSLCLNRSNINLFQEKSLVKWFKKYKEVIEIISIYHVLKYPVALQHTPLYEKFGINLPAGGFLVPEDSMQLRKIFDKETLELLQSISDHDENAIRLFQEIKNLPNISSVALEKQIKSLNEGFFG